MLQSLDPDYRERLRRRLYAKIDRRGADACWPWTASGRKGYGLITVHGVKRTATRLVYRFEKGEIPEGFHVCHTCDNPSCCNPAHLFLGTFYDNMRDRTAKKREVRGEKHPQSQLTAKQVRTIRQQYATGNFSQRKLAKEYRVGQTTIGQIVRREKWQHLR
ncbi:MAG: HNH endonuclease [Anaerolineae bacterium]|nr:HNH endonuclease [Anaerolineae bacterium]MCO5207771.1 HNH endonuclease [Anaerolineae bacterium]